MRFSYKVDSGSTGVLLNLHGPCLISGVDHMNLPWWLVLIPVRMKPVLGKDILVPLNGTVLYETGTCIGRFLSVMQ